MSKRIASLLLLCGVWLSGCSSQPSWEDEELEVVSDRLLADNVEAVWTVEEQDPTDAKHPAHIRIAMTKKDGTIIDRFDITHEKLLHLIVVSKDLSYFNHIHPVYVGGGVFEIDNDFPSGGSYRMIADFKPTGGDPVTKMTWVSLQEEPDETNPTVPVVPNGELVDTADGVQAKLNIERLGAKTDSTLTFELSDAATGKPVADLEPYLGAIGHVVVLSEDGSKYVHVHAEDGQGAGPEAVFEASFPSQGIYTIWAQFQRKGRVFTMSYVVDVPREAATGK
ncbi:MAG: hypothetical protein J7559_11630 [Cohnella sp.]|nr:hypothetical protein [Cohnella sp.]